MKRGNSTPENIQNRSEETTRKMAKAVSERGGKEESSCRKHYSFNTSSIN